MKGTYLQLDKAGPFWAVLGAPLVGVPLMVAFLALGSGTAMEAALETDPGFAVEQVLVVETPEGQDSEALHKD